MSLEHASVSPSVSFADEPVHIRIQDLTPNQQITLRLVSSISGYFCLESHATFAADTEGVVDLKKHAPISGMYTEIEDMGLFWTQRWSRLNDVPQVKLLSVKPPTFQQPLPNKQYLLTIEVGEQVIDFVQFQRVILSDTIVRVPIRERGLVGTLFHARNAQPNPGVMIWGGSEGGMSETCAALLANHGFTTLSLAYFRMEHLPAELVCIPLEYIETAIDWFQELSVVQSERGIGIIGSSRGGELALLVASQYPNIRAVVSFCGSGVIIGGLHKTRDFQFPAWTNQGNPIPHVHEGKSPWERGVDMTNWADFCNFCGEGLKKSMIPVERIQGAILMFSGGRDRIWNSVELANVSMNRLKECGFNQLYEHVQYQEAGHVFALPYSPVDGERYGGTRKANADAGIDSWIRTIDFLKSNLKAKETA